VRTWSIVRTANTMAEIVSLSDAIAGLVQDGDSVALVNR
jgi:hypothetical protein